MCGEKHRELLTLPPSIPSESSVMPGARFAGRRTIVRGGSDIWVMFPDELFSSNEGSATKIARDASLGGRHRGDGKCIFVVDGA
jgi:hypothetical protein